MEQTSTANNVRCRTVRSSLQEYARGITGGLIFSLPLLYTMEMWWTGFIVPPERLLLCLGFTFLLLLGYNRYAGLRRDANMGEVAIDSVEELGLGLLLSALVLFLLGRIGPEISLQEAAGKIILEGMTVAIGVSVGTAQLGGGGDGEETGCDQGGLDGDDDEPGFGGQLTIGFCGAVLFAANVGATEEIVQIGLEANSVRLLGLCLLSLLLAGTILYGSEFRGASNLVLKSGAYPVLRGTIVSYGIALVASAVILWFFGRLEGNSFLPALKQIVVLAMPAALGASGGRLLLQSQPGGGEQ